MTETRKWITYKHLERLLTCQEYFVWNSNVNKIIDQIKNDENDEIISSSPENENSFWEIFSDFNLEELEDYKFVEIIKSGYDDVNKLFVEQIQKEAQEKNKTIFIVNEKSNELAFKKTTELLNDSSVDWIINPVFLYDDLISKCSLYKKDKGYLYTLIHKSRTFLKNYIKAYFDYSILNKLNIKINEYLFFTYDNKKDYQKNKDLSFVSSNYCWTQKNGPNKDIKISIEEHAKDTIVEKLKSSIIKAKQQNKKNNNSIIPEVILDLKNFDEYINQIRETKNINEIPKSINQKDLTPWGENPHFYDLYEFKKFPKVSGNLLNKNELLEIWLGQNSLKNLSSKKKTLNQVLLNKNIIRKDEIVDVIKDIEKSKVVWYDFEGFSMPYSILAHTNPYQQIVFQLSLIRTESEEQIFKNNIVIDPKTISYNDLINIVDNIYWDQADFYVVYNKSYEHTRLNEIINLLEKENVSPAILSRVKQEVETIKEKTIDLLVYFNIDQSKTKTPPIFIAELLGFSSIKKLEKYINEHNLNLEVMIQPYKELEVQNGLMAMNKGIQRYLNSIGDKEWEKTSKDLAKYCENDVKAMIMVYFFIKYIFKNW